MSYENYLAELRNGGVAPKFKYLTRILFTNTIQQYISNELGGDISKDLNSLSYRCSEATFPGRNFNTTEYRYNGPMKKMPFNFFFDDVSINIICSENMIERKIFEAYNEFLYDDRYNQNYFDTYKCTVEILTKNFQDVKTFGVRLIDAYPITLEPINVMYSTQTEFNSFKVRFNFRDYERITL